MMITWNGKKWQAKYKIYFPDNKETLYCQSACFRKGFLCLKGITVYKADSYNNKLESIGNRDIAGLKIIRVKLTKDVIL